MAITTLPIDAALSVCSHLDFQSIRHLSETCRATNSLVKNNDLLFVRAPEYGNLSSLDRFELVIRDVDQLDRNDNKSEEYFRTVSLLITKYLSMQPHFGDWNSLTLKQKKYLSSCHNCFSNLQQLQDLLEQCPNLTEMILQGYYFDEDSTVELQGLNNLKSLEICSHDLFLIMVRNAPNIEELKIYFNASDVERFQVEFPKLFPELLKLKSLEVRLNEWFSEKDFREVFDRCPNLECLRIMSEDIGRIEEVFNELSLERLSMITSLGIKFDFFAPLSWNSLSLMLTKFPNIEKLFLYGSSFFEMDNLTLPLLSKVKFIEIDQELINYETKVIELLISNCPNLERIVIREDRGCNKYTFHSFEKEAFNRLIDFIENM